MGWTGINDGVNPAIEIVEDVPCAGRADVSKHVGAGRGDRNAGTQDDVKRYRVRRHPNANKGAIRCYDIRHGRGARQEKCQWARPKLLHQALCGDGNLGDKSVDHGVLADRAGDMNDHRIPGRALLGGKDPGDCITIQSVRSKAIDGLRRESDEAARSENLSSPADDMPCFFGVEARGVNGQAESLHVCYFHLSPARAAI